MFKVKPPSILFKFFTLNIQMNQGESSRGGRESLLIFPPIRAVTWRRKKRGGGMRALNDAARVAHIKRLREKKRKFQIGIEWMEHVYSSESRRDGWPGKFPLICVICTIIKKQNGRCEQQPISAASAPKPKFVTDRGTKFFVVKKTRRRCWWSFNWFSHASASSAEIAGQPVIGRPDVAPLIESINANEICPCTKEHRSATHFPSANEIFQSNLPLSDLMNHIQKHLQMMPFLLWVQRVITWPGRGVYMSRDQHLGTECCQSHRGDLVQVGDMATAAIRKLAHRQQMCNELVKLCNFLKRKDGSVRHSNLPPRRQK